ncbi:VaFE repeat-containing surface-anchored protein [Corynebacterium sp. Marseille-Q3615]|uniref:VaFE repeat-containing surface-anchored protein n=1 Tax=Corynebacterium haemomassiliense TaxID=2754726 RepID=A0A7W2EAV1_9CORY|nr:VaFE repeat-containing surface-anchored protein [Corynebacterium haemomassiliense]
MALGNEGGTWSGKVVDSAQYTGGENKLGSTNPEAKERAEKINWIVSNSYPHLSPAEMGFPNATIPDIVPATAAAVWVISADATIDRSELEDGQLAIFDYLMNNVKPLPMDSEYSGKFIQSDAQDVVLVPPRNAPKPKISTTASFSESELVKTSPGQAPTDYVWDTVNIENIYPGYEYTLRGELFRKDANGKLRSEDVSTESFKTSDPKFTVTSENADGTVSGTIVVRLSDAEDIEKGEVGVVYERLTANGITADGLPQVGNHLIAAHEDPNDESQIVKPYWTETPTSQTSPDSPGTSNPVVPPTPATEETTTVTPTVTETAPAVTTTQPGKTVVTTEPDVTTTQPGKTTTETQPDVTTTQPGNTVVTTEPDVTTTQPGNTVVTTEPDVTTTQPGKTTTETQPDVTTTQPGNTVVTTEPDVTTTQPGNTVVTTEPDVTTTQPGNTVVTTEPDVTTTQPGNTVVTTEPDVTTTQPGNRVVTTEPDVTTTQPGTTVTSTAPAVTVTETPTVTTTNPNETVTTTVKQGFKPNPEIRTVAEFKDGVNVVQNGSTVVDTVYYSGLVAGKSYTLDAKLVDKQDANNVLGTGAVTFVVPGTEGELANGNVKVEIAVTNAPNPVQAAVAFERLTSKDVNKAGEETDGKKSNPIADHEDIADEDQTVRTVFEPSIATNAKFKDGSTEIAAGNTVIDTVDYKGLVPGKEYTLSAKLMERIGDQAPYQEGNVLGTGTTTFTPETTDGSVEVEIKVNDDVTKPVDAAVAFEDLTSTVVDKAGQDNPKGGDTPETSDDNPIAEHKDINDANQTVGAPHISTNANFEKGSSEVINGAVVVDTVTYAGLVPGKEYTLTAQLIDKADGKTVLGTGKKTFTPKEANGSVDVKITVDNAPEGRVVTAAVAFEELTSTEVDKTGNDNPKGGDTPETSDDNPIAEHKEIDDEDQTVRNPKISTNANFANGAQEVKNGVAVVDTVTYEGLVPGKVYTLTADLINKADGKTVLGSGNKTFIPSAPNGSEDVTIVVSNAPEGETVTAAVAFETLTSTQVDRTGKDNPKGGDTPETSDDNPIAEHKDINDKDQTVRSPRIATNANFADGAKQVENGTVVVDTVEYSGLVKDKTYTLTAELKERLGEAAPFREGRTIGTGTETFTAEAENGKVDVRITVEGLNEGEQVAAAVAFEELTSTEVDRNGNDTPDAPGANKIAEHKDINDDKQTVEGPVNTPTTEPSTTTEETTPKETTSEEPTPTTTIQLIPSTDPSAPGEATEETPIVPVPSGETSEEPVPSTTIQLIPSTETTAPTTDVCKPVTSTSTVPGTTEPGTTEPGTTVPGTTGPDTTVPGTTVKESTTEVTTVPETCVSTTEEEPTPETSDESTTTVPAQPGTSEKTTEQTTEPTKVTTSEQPTKPTTPVVPSNTTTPVVPPVVWFPNPQIGTTADFANGAKEVVSGTVVNDTVKYQGLVPGKTYTLTAELVSKDVYNELVNRDAYGDAIIGTGTKTFTASETGNGSVVVEIPVVDGIDTPVRAAVAFETLTSTEVDREGNDNPQGGETPNDVSDDNPIAEHKNINDQNQTVRSPNVPENSEPFIGTNANFAEGATEVVAGATVVDTVRYTGLVPGKTYTLTADLVAKRSGAIIGQGEKQFVASEAGYGSVNVDITVASWVTNPVYAAVAFERLTSVEVDAQGNEQPAGNRVPQQIAEHRDINDAAQTVITPGTSEGRDIPGEPGVSTNADFSKGAEVVNGAVVRDVVKYWGLVPGATYTATAQLMERLGESAPYTEGRVLGTQSVTFTPEAAYGEIVVEIPVTNAEGAVPAAVAFETLTSTEVDRNGDENPKGGNTPDDVTDDNPIAEHKDINDGYQTVETSEGDTPPAEKTTPATTTPSTTTPGAPAEETTPASSTPAPTTAPGEEGSSDFDKKKLWWLLLIPGLGMIPAVLGGGNGSSKPAPKPAPAPQESKPAPAPSSQPAPAPVGQPVPADSPRGEIKQIPSGGTVLEKDMPAYI